MSSFILSRYLGMELLGHTLNVYLEKLTDRFPKWLPNWMFPATSTLAWKIPWAEEPGRLQSMVSRRVGHDWVTSLLLFTSMHWRRKWQPTPVFLPGESQGRGSLVGCRLWGRTESDTTEATWQQQQQQQRVRNLLISFTLCVPSTSFSPLCNLFLKTGSFVH